MALLDGHDVVVELDSREPWSAEASDMASAGNAGAADQFASQRRFTESVKKRSKRGSRPSRVFPPGASMLLAPMIEAGLKQASVGIRELDLITLTHGPGSFTGLRVGVVTAKTLAYSTSAKLLAVNAMDVLAERAAAWLRNAQCDVAEVGRKQVDSCCVVISAQRQQLFCGRFAVGASGEIQSSGPQQILDYDQLLESLTARECLVGPGLKLLLKHLGGKTPKGLMLAPKELWETSARTVAETALRQFERGITTDLWSLEPIYFRPSTAEERAAK